MLMNALLSLSREPGLEDRPGEYLLLQRAMAIIAEAERMLADQRAQILRLERLTFTDELTGLFNRRGLMSYLRRSLGTLRRYGGGSVLIMADLNDFKQVNDTFGHAAGDHVLCEFAGLLSNNVRETDVVARFGGDEFAVLLTPCDTVAGTSRMRNLVELANEARFDWEGHELKVQASIGMATMSGKDTEDGILRRADTDLYANKRSR